MPALDSLERCYSADGAAQKLRNGVVGGVMTISELSLVAVWVHPNHRVDSARLLMQGHNLRSLAVIDPSGIVGVVQLGAIRNAPADALVVAFLDAAPPVLDGTLRIRDAAEQFVRQDLEVAAVVHEDQFLGLLTANVLLRELGRSWDPLTGLSWSDQLREWGIEQLRTGQEVTILFADIDEFGLYNKRFGHIVGDRVLERIASELRERLSPGDVLVRYGGDEFAIGTTRLRDDADRWSQDLETEVEEALSHEEHAARISVGLAGGRRTKERENTHYAATMDALINRASKDCLKRKSEKQKRREQEESVIREAAKSHLRVLSVSCPEEGGGVATVVIGSEDAVYSGIQARAGISALEAVAMASAKALQRVYPWMAFHLDAVDLKEEGEMRSILVQGRLSNEGREMQVIGMAKFEGDLYASVVRAVIHALADSDLSPKS